MGINTRRMMHRLLLGAFIEWLRHIYTRRAEIIGRANEILGPWLSPRRY